MRTHHAFLAFLVAMAFVPAASATLTITPGETVELDPAGGAQTLTFSASVNCESFPESGSQEQTITVEFTYPAGFSGDASKDLTFDASSCLPPGGDPTGDVTLDNQTVSITPGAGAPGEVDLKVDVAEKDGDATASLPFSVAYRTGYTLDVDQEFPVTVNKDPETGEWIPVEFTGTISVTANADTMVMMSVTSEDKQKYGSLDGMFVQSPHIFRDLTQDQLENGIQKTVTFRYTPTSEGWEEDSVTFTTWGHSMANAELKDEYTMTWTFVNGECDEDGDCGGEGPGTPGFEAGILLIALAAAAVVVRRRE